MELKNERYKDMLEYDMDLSDQESDMLADVGLKLITKDKNELINYAVNHILMEMKDKLEKGNYNIKKLIEQEQKSKNKNPNTLQTKRVCAKKGKI